MKRLTAALLVVVSLTFQGCKDEEARAYAAKLVPVLDSYQEQLSQKIKAEQESYAELADNYETARKNSIIDDLAKERVVRSIELGEEVASAKEAPPLSEILGEVLKYGNRDFDTTRTLLQESLGARSRYLTELESLEIELQKIKLLKESLTDLAKSKKNFQEFKEAANFVSRTDAEIDKLVCTDLKEESEALNKELEALAKEIAELNKKPTENAAKLKVRSEAKKEIATRAKSLSERIATKKCA